MRKCNRAQTRQRKRWTSRERLRGNWRESEDGT